ncbi:MAG TPA: redoxin domain-containing protein [Longimicrobium sp.]|uniref:redoxin domain-containing protein n=1 Tax=Longimicrobium sp. TaxID=2029185 RepID=UPI002EDA8093
MIHPSTSRLHGYAAGTLNNAARAGVAAHLERCADCRRAVADMREFPAALTRATDAAPSPAAWDAIAARVSAGDAVLLPVASTEAVPVTRRTPWLRIAAGVLLLLAGAAAAIRSTREAAAEASELSFSPATPVAGGDVGVVYRAGALLAGADSLVLRARLLTAAGRGMAGAPTVRLGTLRRDGSEYRGRFAFPDSAVYAVFAVENGGASRVDHNGEQWDLMAHDRAGRPLPDALLQRVDDVQSRDTRLMEQTARRMTELYPERVDGWMWLFHAQTANATRERADSVTREHRARLQAFSARLRARSARTAEEVSGVLWYADALDDSAAAHEWRDWMYRNAPLDVTSRRHRVFQVVRGRGPERLAELERMWEPSGDAVAAQVPFSGFQLAAAAGDDEALLRWGDRMVRIEPRFIAVLARMSMTRPAIRPAAMERTRLALRDLDAGGDDRRPLTATRAEHERSSDGARGLFLGLLGRALAETGSTRAALDTLSRAVAATWDPAVFRGAAQVRLQVGDTAGALPLLARVAADPSTGAGFADSARAMLGARYDRAGWAREVAAGHGEMRARVMRSAVNLPVRGEIRLQRPGGGEQTFSARSDSVTVVAFWSRWCMPSKQDLPELQQIAAELRRRGVRVITVTHDEPPAALREFLASNGLTFPVFFDPDNAARRALQNQGTPNYIVLDRTGRIRFHTYGTEDLLAQADALRDGADAPVDAAVTNADR